MDEKKRKKKRKRKLSKMSVILITLIWLIAMSVTLIWFIDSIKNKNKLDSIKANIKIPEGFYYVGGDIDSGVIISDNKQDEFKGTKYETLTKLQGNQFVWVPVEKAIADNFQEAKKMVSEGKNPLAIKYNNDYKRINYVFDSYYKSYTIIEEDYSKNETTEPYIVKGEIYGDSEEYIEGSTKGLYQTTFNKMVESVEKNKGFYISRFEVGNLENAVKNNEKVVSKPYQDDITYQSWIDLYKIIRNMYDREDITTEMIWGCQWDATLVWILQNPDLNKAVYNTKQIGNYYNKLEKTASDSKYTLNNIYDLAGNAYEWTQRGSDIGGRIAVGGSYLTDKSLNYSLGDKKVYGITYLWKEVGTRMTMYVN